MSKALPLDLRSRVLRAVADGASHRQAAARFGVSAARVSRWRALERSQGDARPGPLGGDRRSARVEAQGGLPEGSESEIAALGNPPGESNPKAAGISRHARSNPLPRRGAPKPAVRTGPANPGIARPADISNRSIRSLSAAAIQNCVGLDPAAIVWRDAPDLMVWRRPRRVSRDSSTLRRSRPIPRPRPRRHA